MEFGIQFYIVFPHSGMCAAIVWPCYRLCFFKSWVGCAVVSNWPCNVRYIVWTALGRNFGCSRFYPRIYVPFSTSRLQASWKCCGMLSVGSVTSSIWAYHNRDNVPRSVSGIRVSDDTVNDILPRPFFGLWICQYVGLRLYDFALFYISSCCGAIRLGSACSPVEANGVQRFVFVDIEELASYADDPVRPKSP